MTETQEITNKDIYDILQTLIQRNVEIEKGLKENREILKNEIAELKRNFGKELHDLRNENETLKRENDDLRKQLNTVDRRTRKYNLIIYGLQEEEEKSSDIQHFLRLCNEKLRIKCSLHDFRDIARIGKKKQDKIRPLLVEVVSHQLKDDILENKSLLKGSSINVSLDYIPSDYKNRKILGSNLKLARNQNIKAYIKNNCLYLDGERYTVEDLIKETPKKLQSAIDKSNSSDKNQILDLENVIALDKILPIIEDKTGTKRKQPAAETSKATRSTRTNNKTK